MKMKMKMKAKQRMDVYPEMKVKCSVWQKKKRGARKSETHDMLVSSFALIMGLGFCDHFSFKLRPQVWTHHCKPVTMQHDLKPWNHKLTTG